ncbi:MAG: polysaccharide deacetylase family protein [Bifidobacteriaceae bacterium]|nr:polysaccharide deacetylase family protein [Bifidobacteriaceae bacterium]
MDNTLYDYSPITERPPIEWPGGKKLAFYVGLNIEHFHIDKPATSSSSVTAGFVPDPMNHGWRDYGTRVGIWRMMKLFDEVGLRASAITNSEVCTHYPQIIEAAVARNWAWIAHGQTNSIMQANMDEATEVAFLDQLFAHFDAVLPARPKGWLGPALTETFNTPRLLQERGVQYLLDWNADDRPFRLNQPGLIEIPYGIDINDIQVFVGKAVTGSAYEEMVLDHFEVMLAEGGGVMALPVHPFVVGQPYRFKHFANVIRTITSHPDVWVTTTDDIAAHVTPLLPN